MEEGGGMEWKLEGRPVIKRVYRDRKIKRQNEIVYDNVKTRLGLMLLLSSYCITFLPSVSTRISDRLVDI